MANKDITVARFFMHTVENETKTKKAGRPIYDEYEAVEIRFSANRFTKHVAPAHEVFRRDKNFQTGEVTEVTYAMEFNDVYKKFKAGEAQDQSGTPLSELISLTQAKRLELKALNIHTVEALASIDGPPLKNLGMGGRELKNLAQVYLDKAAGSVDVVAMAAKMTAMQAEIDRLKGGAQQESQAEPVNANSPFVDMEDIDIRNWIEAAGGAKPRSNATHASLVKAADELNAAISAKKAVAA